MVELARRYCEVCESEGVHLIKTYYDGTVVQVCIKCRHNGMIKLGYDHNKINKMLEDEELIEKIA